MTGQERQAVEAEHARQNNIVVKLGWALMLSIVANVLVLMASVMITVKVNESTERKFCDVISTQDTSAPVTTQHGQEVIQRLRVLARKLGCPEPRTPETHPSGGK